MWLEVADEDHASGAEIRYFSAGPRQDLLYGDLDLVAEPVAHRPKDADVARPGISQLALLQARQRSGVL